MVYIYCIRLVHGMSVAQSEVSCDLVLLFLGIILVLTVLGQGRPLLPVGPDALQQGRQTGTQVGQGLVDRQADALAEANLEENV